MISLCFSWSCCQDVGEGSERDGHIPRSVFEEGMRRLFPRKDEVAMTEILDIVDQQHLVQVSRVIA